MGLVKIRVPRTSQPQDACGIDQGNAFGKNVVFSSPDCLRSQDRVATRIGTVTQKPTVNGTAAEFNGTSWLEYGTKPIIQPNSAFTILLYEETAVVGTFSSLFSIPVGSNQFIFIRGTAAEYRCSFGIAGGSGGYLFAGAGSQTAGEKIRFVITGSNISDRTTYKLWANGVKHTGVAATFGSLAAQSIKIGWDGADTKFNGLIQDVFFLDREVSDEEAIAITDNPWQIFEPEEQLIWVPGTASVTLPAIGRPISDTTPGAWVPSIGRDLWACLDEPTPDDADYISVDSASMCETALDATVFPGGDAQVVSYRASSTSGSTLTIRLRQSGSTIASWTHALIPTITTYQQTLTAPQIASIAAGGVSVQMEVS